MVTRTSTIAPPFLPPKVVTTAMSMARKSALGGGSRAPAGEDLDVVRLDLMNESAGEVELYVGRMLFRGPSDAGRQCVTEVVLDEAAEIALCPPLPNVSGCGVVVDAIQRWDDSTEAYVDAQYQARPAGMVRLPERGDYRLSVTLTPTITPPWSILATARLFGWRDKFRTGQEQADGGQPMPASGGMLKSGAGSVCRMHRRHWPA